MNDDDMPLTRAQMDTWWRELPEETRQMLDISAMSCPLQLPRWPYWDRTLCVEILAWGDLWTETLQAYADFLSKGKARAARHGREWDHAELLRQERLTEAGE